MTAAIAEQEETVDATDERWWTQAGMSYRQLDYWTAKGYLRVTEDSTANPGSGNWRRWPVEELAVAARMIRLIDAAGMALDQAAAVARMGFGVFELGPGVWITVIP